MVIIDLRKKENLIKFQKSYYFAMYDLNDNFIMIIEDIRTATKLFNMPFKKIVENLRNNKGFVFDGSIVKLFPYKKFSI